MTTAIAELLRRPIVTRFLERGKGWIAGRVIASRPIRLVSGVRLCLNPRDTVGLSHYLLGRYERDEVALARKLIRQGDVVFDIGANIGYWSILLAKMVGESGRVVAFEPDPSNFVILKRNLEMNGLTQVIPLESGLGDVEGVALLYRSKFNAGDSSFSPVPDAMDVTRAHRRRLDSVCRELDLYPSFIKVDVQGHELEVLRGYAGAPREAQSRLKGIVEFDSMSLARNGIRPEQFWGVLRAEGFRVCRIGKNGAISQITDAEFRNSSRGNEETCINVFLERA